MERKINNLTICYTLYLILIFLSGSLLGVLSIAVRFLAFLIPFALGIAFLREEETTKENYLSISVENLKLSLPLVFPTVLSVMLLSGLTSILIKLVSGAENNVDVGNALVPALISHAVVPALFEEMLFRYLPMRMLSGHSKKLIILVSATFFALVHRSMFSFGYAFVAGVIFMAIDLASGSVIPSIFIHFINNALSVGMMVYKDNPIFAPTNYTLVVILAVISFVFIALNWKKYVVKLSSIFDGGEKYTLTRPALLFGAICIFMAVVNIL